MNPTVDEIQISKGLLWALGIFGALAISVITVLLNHWLTRSTDSLDKKANKEDVDQFKKDMKHNMSNFKMRIGEEMDLLREAQTLGNKTAEKNNKILVYLVTKDGASLSDVQGLIE